ncbi:N6-adenosine-methyltransferase TMT1A-like [Osmerus eperlanus]|uniref:N6-adenosine-methyltransferase TMT1A-like n=2 Tax=Osmerus TaxID=8013 RepID=UPI002E0FBA67
MGYYGRVLVLRAADEYDCNKHKFRPRFFWKMRYFMNFCKIICWIICLPLLFMEIVGIYGIYKRLFPLLAYNITFSYNDKMHENKRDLFKNLNTFANTKDGTLRLLEIGCGSGANFKFYPYGCTVICTDPNLHFKKYLQMSMDTNMHLTYEQFVVSSGEDLRSMKDESVDVVVCTLVLCSVINVPRVLEEAKRILKPGGALYFLEHVVSDPTTWTYFLQHVLQPLWYYLGDGCVVTRATWKDLEAAGFSKLKLKHIEAPQVTLMIRPHILGYAIK